MPQHVRPPWFKAALQEVAAAYQQGRIFGSTNKIARAVREIFDRHAKENDQQKAKTPADPAARRCTK